MPEPEPEEEGPPLARLCGDSETEVEQESDILGNHEMTETLLMLDDIEVWCLDVHDCDQICCFCCLRMNIRALL